jgi:hypothetical protein
MLKHFNMPNGGKIYVEDTTHTAVAVIDMSPESYSTLVEIPYPSDTSNYEELYLDVFARVPLQNLVDTSKSSLEVLAAKYLLSQIPLL